jgi:hypothetical protein
MNPHPLKRWIATATLAGLAAFAAHADDPVNGQAQFAASCTGANCHGSSPLNSNANKIYNGRNARNVIDAAINNVGDMKSLRAAFPAGGAALANVAAYLGNTPSALSFASTAVGSTSAPQTINVYASLKSGAALSAISVAVAGDFARSGGTCGTSLATGTSCTLLVTFTPTASGSRTGTLSLTHNNALTPIAFALSGSGSGSVTTAPVASITPSAITLASTAIGATSAAQNVNVANTGNAALSISAITLSNPADFVIAGGTCAAGGSVAAGSSCTVSVAFKPAAGATGTRSGSLSISHNAAGSPGSVALSGNATAAAAPIATLTASLAFGSVNVGSTSAAQTATLANSGTAPLSIATLVTGSTEFAISGGSCVAGGTVAAGASCSINLSFTPSSAGARSATLTATHNAGSSSTSLSGTGVALSPVIGVSPTSLSFSQTVNTASSAQTVTVSNSGSAPLLLSALSLSGAQAAEFSLASGTTCVAGGSIAAGASCSVKLTFTPAASGMRSASLAITHNAAGSPSSVTLNGSGTATPQPAISLNATSLAFSSQVLATASAAQSVTVSNSGAATLTFSGLTLAGSAAADFTRGGTCSAGGTLAAGASCSVSFSFTPSAIGTRSATLTLASDASNGSAVLSMSGTGAALPAPAVSLSPGSLAFGNQTVGMSSSVRSVTLANTGSGAFGITAVTASAGFGVSHNCGASLAAGASCTLSVSFTPSTIGSLSGNISVASNAAGSPHAVNLSGSGVATSPVLVWTPAASSVDFGSAVVGASPASRTLTLANQGPGAVVLQQFGLAGANAGDFSLGNGGSCVLNASLAQGAACSLVLAFQPGTVGARAAALQVLSSGSNPPALALNGNGSAAAQPAASTVPSALNFSVAAGIAVVNPQTLSLHSSGNAVLHVGAMRIAAGSFTLAAAPGNGCPAAPFDLLPGQSCALAVTWSSSASGAESGLVEIDTNAAATPLQVPLQGQREDAASIGGTGAPSMSNVGAGGCSIARGDSLADPTLWLLVALAAGVLWRRRARP